jgi:all-trans-8'-apo-beta-carotenal 15,15'-oxygenase
MDRRRFLRDFLSSIALASTPALLRAQVAQLSTSESFERGLAIQPWLAGWKTASRESFGPTVATLEGRLPADLAGVLYRNGPAWFDRAGFRYHHWFDGDGMLSAWRIGGGAIEHRASMVATAKFERERRSGRFLLPAGGTVVPDAQAIRNNDDMNTANTAVIRHQGRLLALWEGGSATELDPDSLRTLGPVTWREDMVAAPFSAHPLQDRDGSLWNFGLLSMVGGSGILIWHIGADGKLARTAMLPVDAPGYMHAFAMTDRHLVFMLSPYRSPGEGVAFFERLRFQTREPCRIAVVPKDALDAPRWFELPFAMAYHFGQAYERKGVISVPTVRHFDVEQMRSPMQAAMRGERDEALPTDLALMRLDLGSGRGWWDASGLTQMEFPTFDARFPDSKAGRVFAPTGVGPASAPYSNAIGAYDVERGRSQMYRYGTDVMVEEHVFVPRRDSRKPGAGWLVGTWLDHGRGRSGIAVLDAERVSEGPVAQAWVPYVLPLGFHGTFAVTG